MILLENLILEAEVQLSLREWGQARNKARLLLQRLPDPKHVYAGRAHRILGFVDFQKHKPKRGLQHFEKALVIFDQHDLFDLYRDVTLHLSHHLAEQGQYEEAFQRLIDLDDKLVKSLIRRGVVVFSKKFIAE
ncbi:tetratricopeptide repeat protein [Tumebacillus avium]|nr:hypothetical protein [Tumebacillus avium]